MKVEKNALEWAVFVVSLALLAAVVAGLVVDASRGGADAPQLEVHLGAAERLGPHFRLPLVVENRGGATAQAAVVEVTLQAGGREVERAELSFAFLPRRSTRRGWVVFRHDPSCCEVVARPLGFETP